MRVGELSDRRRRDLSSSATASSSRILQSAVDQLRAQGIKAGLLRPITLFPFPSRELRAAGRQAERVRRRGVEHRKDGGRRAAGGRRPRAGGILRPRGGNMPSAEEICRGHRTCSPRSGTVHELNYEITAREGRRASTTTSSARARLQQQTHYCPGCGHGIVHKLIAECIDELGIQRPHDPGLPGRLLGLRLLLLRRRQRPGGARARAGGRDGAEARASRIASSSAIRATATWRRSARPRSCTPPIAARTSPCSSSTTRFTA